MTTRRSRVSHRASPPWRDRPQSLSDLFISFTLLALQGFGGVLAVVQRELVERKRWLTQEEFIEDWAVAQIMPGPNVVNLSLMVGGRYFGLPGALAALGRAAGRAAGAGARPGRAARPLRRQPAGGRRPARHGRRLGRPDRRCRPQAGHRPQAQPAADAWCVGIAALGFVLVALLKCPLIYVLLGLGGLGCILTYRRLKS
jgi:chromate transporter